MEVKTIGSSYVVAVTPTVSANAAYTANDQVGGIQTLTNAIRPERDDHVGSFLTDLVVVDSDGQGAAIDIFFFNSLPTVASTDNAAISITAAQLQDKCLGSVTVATGDYVACGSIKVATVKNVGLRCVSASSSDPQTQCNIYAVACTRGTPTYTTTSAVTFKYSFAQD
jgi:hypothetical protein